MTFSVDYIAQTVFWACFLPAIYTYLFYPVLLFLLYSLVQGWRDLRYLASWKDRRVPHYRDEELPPITLVIPAYNEQEHLPARIENVRQSDYPRHLLEVLLVSDGSTDLTNQILTRVPDQYVRTLLLPERRGKVNAINHAVRSASHDILILSDCGTRFAPDAVKKLVRHFKDPAVGVVCGALRFEGSQESRNTEGVYWRYEQAIRLMEARLGGTLTASGAVYAVRKQCYKQLPDTTLIEDLVIPMNARRLGYRILYDPEAVAWDVAASSVAGEFQRRVRLALGSFRALPTLARVPLDAFTALAFVSHKLLRWFLPFLFIAMFASNLFLAEHSFYRVTLLLQCLALAWAGTGFLLREQLKHFRFALVGYYLFSIHLAFLVGFFQLCRGHRQTSWDRVG